MVRNANKTFRNANTSVPKPRSWVKIVVITLIVVLVLAIAGFILLIVLISGFINDISGSGTPNPAETDVKPLLQRLDALGAQQICNDSYNGQGLDAVGPHYYGYYKLADAPGLDSAIQNAATQSGYQLNGTNQPNTDTLPGNKPAGGTVTELDGQKGNQTVSVQIYRNAKVALDCSSAGLNETSSTGGGVIIDVSDSLPQS